MDPLDRFSFRRRIKWEAIVAFLVAVIVAYVIQVSLALRGGGLFTALIVIAVGGLWYHIRRVV